MTKPENPFRFDLRTLALFRIGVGVSVLFVLLSDRWLASVPAHENILATYSLHGLTHGSAFEFPLFVLATIVALCVCIGLRTRQVMIANWFLLASLYSAYPKIVQPSDNLVMAMVFVGLFLPLNARYSVDAALNRDDMPDDAVLSIATFALLVLCVLSFAMPSINALVADNTPVARPTDWFLTISPLVALLGTWLSVLRTLAIAILIGAIGVLTWQTARIDYPVPFVVAVLCFVPPAYWEWSNRTAAADRRAALYIYYDRDCGFCLKTCLIFRTFFALGPIPINPAQDTPAAFETMQRYESWVVTDHDGTQYVRWHAILLLLRRSPLFWLPGEFLTAIGMGRWADGLYELIARNRNLFSRITAHVLPFRSISLRKRGTAETIAGFWLVLLLAINLPEVISSQPVLAELPAAVAALFGLDQQWHQPLFR